MDISKNCKGLKQWNYLAIQEKNKRHDRQRIKCTKIWSICEVVLVLRNLIDNRYQQKSEVLYTFNTSKSFDSLLNVESSNLVLLKTCNIEFDEIIIIFREQNSRTL